MKSIFSFFFVFSFLLVLSAPSWADNTANSDASAGAQASATGGSAQAGATGGSVSVGDISPSNSVDVGVNPTISPSNSNKVDIGVNPTISPSNSVSVGVNPTISPSQGQKQSVDNHPSNSNSVNSGQTVAPKTSSQVNIDNHSRTKIRNINRQFLPVGSVPPAGTLQMFVPPKDFGLTWNWEGVYLGVWRRAPDRSSAKKTLAVLKDKPPKRHRYIYHLPSMRKTLIIAGKEPLRGASPVGEIDGMASSREDCRSLQMFAIDRLTNWGANIILFVANGPFFESWSAGSNKGVKGSSSQLATALEKVVFGEGLEYSHQDVKGGVNSFPVVQAIGYWAKPKTWKSLVSPPSPPPTSEKTERSKKYEKHDGKKWEVSHSSH